VVRFTQKPHSKFQRRDNDIIYSHRISLCDGLVSTPISFRTIDNEEIKEAVDQVIGPSTEKVIKGKGMPIENNDPLGPIKKTYRRGDLIVKFDIQFPTQLSDDVR
jgi:DnaJ-class molecular chaperone